MVSSDSITPTPSQSEASAAAPVRVLLIDDQIIIAETLRRLLSDQPDIAFHWAATSQQARETALRSQPTVILLDLVMPDMDGFGILQHFRADPQTADIPIIVLSTTEDAQTKAQSFAAGANDYLIKFPDKIELLARLRYHTSAFLNGRERDEAFRALRESEQRLAEANIRLHKLSEVDGLTRIANRRRFNDVLHTEWQRAMRIGCTLSLLLCDVDAFKAYNDTYGHLAGDECLQKVAAVVARCVRRPTDLAARYGGEEFAIILPETEHDGALSVAEACRSQVEALALSNENAPAGIVTMSVGVASLRPTREDLPLNLIGLADRALYRAKKNGRNRVETAS